MDLRILDSSPRNKCISIHCIPTTKELIAIPSLDLVLTTNGFGIVSNQNVVPASRERVDALISSLE